MKTKQWIRQTFLQHPLITGMDLDDPATTSIRRQIIQDKTILKNVYLEWYNEIQPLIPAGNLPVLEIGSGASFLDEFCDNLILTDIMLYQGIDTVLDAHHLPLMNESLKAMVMTNVFHHLPDPVKFFSEASRCVCQGGKIILVEPWVTAWSTLVFQKFHHEPFDPQADTWESPVDNPLSGANGALPWIIFHRDRKLFETRFPEWKIRQIKPWMPIMYLASGGITSREIIPRYWYRPIKSFERVISPLNTTIAMFALIEIQRD